MLITRSAAIRLRGLCSTLPKYRQSNEIQNMLIQSDNNRKEFWEL